VYKIHIHIFLHFLYFGWWSSRVCPLSQKPVARGINNIKTNLRGGGQLPARAQRNTRARTSNIYGGGGPTFKNTRFSIPFYSEPHYGQKSKFLHTARGLPVLSSLAPAPESRTPAWKILTGLCAGHQEPIPTDPKKYTPAPLAPATYFFQDSGVATSFFKFLSRFGRRDFVFQVSFKFLPQIAILSGVPS